MGQTPYTILHTEWSDGWGGQEQRILSEMNGMQVRGHRVILACRAHARLAEYARKHNIAVHTFPFSGKFHLPSIWGLKNLITAKGVQIVNTHSGIDSWVGALAAKIAGVHLIRTRHLDIPLKRSWYNFVHFMPDRIVTCGQHTRQKLIAQCGFPADQICSIPTGIDFATFTPKHSRNAMREKLKLQETSFVILMVGVIRAVKRHEIALRAFAQLVCQQPDACLLLAGDGPMLGDMQALAAQLKITERVFFLGWRNDIPDLLGASDCLLLTSRSEGVPQAVTQALGCAVPTVATRVGGIPELIEDQKSGWLVEVDDLPSIVNALHTIATSPAKARQIGLAGQAHALAHFSQQNMLLATETIYAQILGKASP